MHIVCFFFLTCSSMCGQIKYQHIHCITLYTYNAGIAVVGIDKDASKMFYVAHKYTFTASAIHLIYGNVRTIIITTISQCLGYWGKSSL